jgi:hypothetical protein
MSSTDNIGETPLHLLAICGKILIIFGLLTALTFASGCSAIPNLPTMPKLQVSLAPNNAQFYTHDTPAPTPTATPAEENASVTAVPTPASPYKITYV